MAAAALSAATLAALGVTLLTAGTAHAGTPASTSTFTGGGGSSGGGGASGSW